MITIHHLRVGRSLFTVWLLEELGVDYHVKEYLRDPQTMRAPESLKAIHPLGKSPIIEDGDLMLTESGAIAAYLIDKYDVEGRFKPSRDNAQLWGRYLQWLHYPEGSLMLGLMIQLLLKRGGQANEVLDGYSRGEIRLHLDYITEQLRDRTYILGDDFSGADVCLSCALHLARKFGELDDHPVLTAYLERALTRPAFQRAVDRVIE